jgi:curved DNA-binding protein CbpA
VTDPRQVLGIEANASEEEIRAAYLRRIKEHPPDSSPEEFERIRDAYETLRDPRRRAQSLLFAVDPEAPMTSLIADRRTERRFVGPNPWLAALKKG